MAFWAVEIKPGKPFTHTDDGSKGRLHISMATLGHGTAITKSTLQCNVGNKSPVYICTLYPGKTESLQLNLEFEEDGNVIFSVIGPRSIHLCGYYLVRGRYSNILDESESYGEDIGDTENEKSVHSDEDDYDDSFIDDDGDLAVYPPSPISNEEEASYDSGRKSAKGSRRRLRKKYQLVESDDDTSLEEKKIVNDSVHVQSQEIDNEDCLPISSICKSKASVRIFDQEMDENVDKDAVDTGKKDSEDPENSTIETKLKTDDVVADYQTHREAEPSDHLAVPCTVPDVGDIKKLKKKKKGKEKETKSSCNEHSTELDNASQDEQKVNTAQDLLDQEMTDIVDSEAVDAGKKDSEDPENSTIETKLKTDNVDADIQTQREAEPSDPLAVPCTVPDVGDIKKSKKKKTGKEKETKRSCNDHSTELDNAAQDEQKVNTAQDLLDQEMTDIVDSEAVDAGKKDSEDPENSTIETKLKTDNVDADIQTQREAEPSDPLAVPCTVPDVGDIKKSKKKKTGKEKETKRSCNDHSTELDNAAQDEQKVNTAQDLLDQEMTDIVDSEAVDAGKKDSEDPENSTIETKLKTDNVVADIQTEREAEPSDPLAVPCTVPVVGDVKKSKKKNTGKEKETKSSCNDHSTELDNAAQDVQKMNTAQDLLDQEMADNVDNEAVDAGKKDGEDPEQSTIETKLKIDNVVADIQTQREAEPSNPLAVPCIVPNVGDIKKSKKKKKGKEKETKSSCNDHSTEQDNAAQVEQKLNTAQDLLDQEMADNVDKEAFDAGKNEQHQQQADDKKAETVDKILPSSKVGQGQDEKPKRKRKERSKEETTFTADDACISNVVNLPQGNEGNNQDIVNRDVKISDNVALPSTETDSPKKIKRRKKEHKNKASLPEGDNGNGEGIIQDEKGNKETAESGSLIHKLSEMEEQHQKLTIENVDNGAQDNPDGNQSEDKKVKKKKKKSKSQSSEVVNSDLPVSVEPSTEMTKEDGNNMEDTKSSQVRTLSNGLVIQELEMGKKKGKIAALGKKISINYTGKLKENGAEVESNAGQAPFKFRLGKGEVIEGLDIGLEGMRVGEKRRLVIPPSMTSKKNGDSENIPPNSWLIYELELVKVH